MTEVVCISSEDEVKVVEITGILEENSKRYSLEADIKSFESKWKNHLTKDECTKVRSKLTKRTAAISDKLKSSRSLHDFMINKITRIGLLKDPKQVWQVIRDVLDELKKYGESNCTSSASSNENGNSCQLKKRVKLTVCIEPAKDTAPDNVSVSPQSDYGHVIKPDLKAASLNDGTLTEEQKRHREAHINRLEQALEKCGKRIKKLEYEEMGEDEMDSENENDSSYLKLSKYKEKFIEIYNKIKELQNTSKSLSRKQDKRFKFEGSLLPTINTEIENLVNRKKAFPDFADIYKLYEKYYLEHNLAINKQKIQQEALDAFEAMGKCLKARRVHDDLDVMYSYLPSDAENDDPANNDNMLEQALTISAKEGREKMDKIWSHIASKQENSNEKPEDVPDNEGDNESEENDNEEEQQTEPEILVSDIEGDCKEYGTAQEIACNGNELRQNSEAEDKLTLRNIHLEKTMSLEDFECSNEQQNLQDDTGLPA